MTKIEKKPYRRGVGAVIFNESGGVFVGERKDSPGAWQFPQGGLDSADEDPWQACLRELKEEIGTDNVTKLGEITDWIRYDFPDYLSHLKIYQTHCGQEQKWYAVVLNGSDDLIDLNAHHTPEFIHWRWVNLEEAPSLIVPFKREMYENLVQEFKAYAPMPQH